MNNEIQELKQEYYEVLMSQEFDENRLDYSRLDRHIEILKEINVLNNSSMSIFDLNRKRHVYISSRFESILGYDQDDFQRDMESHMEDYIHPDDLMILNRSGIDYFKIALAYPREKREKIKDYKYICDYRMMRRDGSYTRVIEQHVVLELDADNNFWLALSTLDVSPDEDLLTPCRVRLINTRTGELYKLPKVTKKYSNDKSLSYREQEILKLIASGLISKQIADKLFISVNTVNTHRQRIIEKLDVSNTTEAITYASSLGMI